MSQRTNIVNSPSRPLPGFGYCGDWCTAPYPTQRATARKAVKIRKNALIRWDDAMRNTSSMVQSFDSGKFNPQHDHCDREILERSLSILLGAGRNRFNANTAEFRTVQDLVAMIRSEMTL